MYLEQNGLLFAVPLVVALGCAAPVAGAGPQGPPGPSGEPGPRGQAGAPGASAAGIAKTDVRYLTTTASGKGGERPIAFVLCAGAHDVLLSGGCQVKADGPYELVANGPDNINDALKPAGWTCRAQLLKNVTGSVTATAFCLSMP